MRIDKLYQRPYSVASAPEATGEQGYEFYVRLVPILRFTTLLWRLPVDHQMRMIGPKGKFMLEPDDDRTHLFISTGTGIAPFIAMTRQLMHEGKPRKTVMLHGCSYQDELGYREMLEDLARNSDYPMTYVPTISRPRGSAQRRLDRLHRPRRACRRRGLPGRGAGTGLHGRLSLRQPGDDPERRERPDGRRLSRVPRQEGALLAQGQEPHGVARSEACTSHGGCAVRPARRCVTAGPVEWWAR